VAYFQSANGPKGIGPQLGGSWGRSLKVPGGTVRHDSDVGLQSAAAIKFCALRVACLASGQIWPAPKSRGVL
jgi:hypothetical protein